LKVAKHGHSPFDLKATKLFIPKIPFFFKPISKKIIPKIPSNMSLNCRKGKVGRGEDFHASFCLVGRIVASVFLGFIMG
jgi:hypothetical protein